MVADHAIWGVRRSEEKKRLSKTAQTMLQTLYDLGLVEVHDERACIMGVSEFRHLTWTLRHVPKTPVLIKETVPHQHEEPLGTYTPMK